MNPNEYAKFKTEIAAFERTAGFDLEQKVHGVEVIRFTVAENAVELEGALLAFQQPAMLPLMFQGNKEKLEQFLLLVTRRTYNAFATFASSTEHLRRLFGTMPQAVDRCRHRLNRELDIFCAAERYLIVQRLRDHSTHHELHVTVAQLTLGRDQSGGDPHEGWKPETSILLALGPVRAGTAGRRTRKKKQAPDPLKGLPDQLPLLPFVNACQRDWQNLSATLRQILLDEYKHYEADVEKTRTRLERFLKGDIPQD